MLNGKFYTGLPPKMIDRGCGGRNRQESHFFWPDETKVDSAVENRAKRRSSLQLEATDSPRMRQQSPQLATEHNEVDTKQMFHKEFAKSSIQFNDNIPEENSAYHARRTPQLYTKRHMRQDITLKPTATKMEMPESVVSEAYTTAKKKQAYTSSIKFYDYVDDNVNARNNTRKPKLDKNDKKEVERNTKNSPKLLAKRDVRNFSTPERRNNDYIGESESSKPETSYLKNNRNPQRIIHNPVFEEKRNRTSLIEQRRKTSPTATYRKDNRQRTHYENYRTEAAAERTMERDSLEREDVDTSFGREQNLPKKILKNAQRTERPYEDDYIDSGLGDVDYIEHGMRNVRVRALPKKHVTYREDTHDDEREVPVHYYLEDQDMTSENDRTQAAHSRRAKPPITRSGSNQRQLLYKPNTPHTPELDDQYMETNIETTTTTSTTKSFGNNDYNKNSNNSGSTRLNNQPRKISPKMSAAPRDASVADPTSVREETEMSESDAQKHLRSSLSFNNGEIVGNNGAATKTPTFNRNVRNSATKRVSVGLPY